MSKVHMLRDFVNQRLTLAAEEIFELFERTMVEYEEELCRQGKLLNAVFQPEVRLHRADVQQLMVNREAVPPEQQIWSPSLDQQNPPGLPNIKEEQEELWTKQEEEQLQLLEEADITKFTLTPLKSEDEEEKRQTSLLHQSLTEELRDAEHLKSDADEEHSGRSEPARNLNPDNCLDETSHFSEPETDDSFDWEELRDSESGQKPLQNNEVLLSDKKINTGEASVISSERATNFGHEGRLQKQKRNKVRPGVRPFRCKVCGKKYIWRSSLQSHMRLHSGKDPFSCSVCSKTFLWRHCLKAHMRVHTGEKPYQCSICKACFSISGSLYKHMRMHSGEKPFSCSICGKTFGLNGQLKQHAMIHTGEKPFSCSVCGKRFARLGYLRTHSYVHTGEKPFSCSVCGKRFSQHVHLRTHSNVHTGEKPFGCSICDKRFARVYSLKNHKCVGDNSRNK